MVPDAHEKLEAYLATDPEARAEWDATQKLKRDPRITTVGRIIRKTSIDELPQLFNVLKGDMSVVGPRPFMVDQQALYHGRRYYDLRPGLTGFWQISDRNECNFAQRAHFDTAYYRSVSLKTDLAVIARTVSVVLRCTGY
jgi:lipopolysaccharide/colanic/teichoic acid biosynthesis glycosyltransferase